MSESKTIIITGAASFLGRNVIAGLLRENYRVIAFVRSSSKNLHYLPQNAGIQYIYGSLEELEEIPKKVDKADAFIHFAWEGTGYEGRLNETVQNKNVVYSMQALEVASKLGCRQFIFSGSQAEYGICREKITEELPCHPVSAYGKAKCLFSEKARAFCQAIPMEFIHLRIFSIYGPGDRAGALVDACVEAFNHGGSMKMGPCDYKWNFLYISDFVNAVLKILQVKCETGIYNIGSDDTRILREFVLEMYALSNRSGRYEFGDRPGNPEGNPSLDPDIRKFSRITGWRPQVTFQNGIQSIMEEKA